MIAENAGKSSQQLFAQFFWRIFKLKEAFNLKKVIIGFYMSPIFFSPSEYWTPFREKLFSSFDFRKGFLFPAGDFADVKEHWGVGFAVFESKDIELWNKNIKHKWTFDLKQLNETKDDVVKVGKKELWYWPPHESMNNWIRVPIQRKPLLAEPQPALSSAIKCSNATKKPAGLLVQDALGYMVNVANNVYKSVQDVWIASSGTYMGHGLSVCKENFERCMVNFAARRLVVDNWMTHIDEFHKPSDQLMSDMEFITDCVVFSIFNTKSNQASVKNIEYNGEYFSFRNQWFPWSKAQILQLTKNVEGLDSMYTDALNGKDSFVCTYLKNKKLSPQAKKVLDLGWGIMKATLDYRLTTTVDMKLGLPLYPDRWDAGWYQIKRIMENNSPLPKEIASMVKNFKIAYDDLSKKIREKVFADKVLLDTQGQDANYGITRHD